MTIPCSEAAVLLTRRDAQDALRVLRVATGLITDEGSWTQGALARDGQHRPMRPGDSPHEPAEWCLLGALLDANLRLSRSQSGYSGTDAGETRVTPLQAAMLAAFVACHEVILREGHGDLPHLLDQLTWSSNANDPADAMCATVIGSWIVNANDLDSTTHRNILAAVGLAQRLLESIAGHVGVDEEESQGVTEPLPGDDSTQPRGQTTYVRFDPARRHAPGLLHACVFRQRQVWIDYEGNEQLIDDMPLEYVRNVIGFCELRKQRIVRLVLIDAWLRLFMEASARVGAVRHAGGRVDGVNGPVAPDCFPRLPLIRALHRRIAVLQAMPKKRLESDVFRSTLQRLEPTGVAVALETEMTRSP